jgi:hypothetical protein
MPYSHAVRLVAVLALILCLPGPACSDSGVRTGKVDPYGDCCVAKVVMTGVSTWNVTCGFCAANPGVYTISQPDPEKLVFTGPGGITADSRYDAAAAVCQCPSQDARRAFEKKMRTFDGN